jgi:hypothetical protein
MRAALPICLTAVSFSVHAHGGGLDSSGCHTKRSTGEYHCHRGSYQPSDARPAQTTPRQAVPHPIDQTCHIGPRGGRYRIVNGRKRYDC